MKMRTEQEMFELILNIAKEEYERLLNTYFDGTVQSIWNSVFIMCDLFGQIAREVATSLSYSYNEEEEKGARMYLKRVHQLPKDATDIF